jgi:hypothetical protein
MVEQVLVGDVIKRAPNGWSKSTVETDMYLQPSVSYTLDDGETVDHKVSIKAQPVELIKWRIEEDIDKWGWDLEDHPRYNDFSDELIEAYNQDDWWKKGPQKFMEHPLKFDKWRLIISFNKKSKIYPNGFHEEPEIVNIDHESLPSDARHIELQVGDYTDKKEMYETMRQLMKDMKTEEGLIDVFETFGKQKPYLKTFGNPEYQLDLISESVVNNSEDDIIYIYSNDVDYLESRKTLNKFKERVKKLKERIESIDVKEEIRNQ